MTLEEIIERAAAGKAMLVFDAPGGEGIYLTERCREVEEELQRELWMRPGAFHVVGGEVAVNAAWNIIHWPETPEAARLADRLGREVTAFVSRPAARRHRPRQTPPGTR